LESLEKIGGGRDDDQGGGIGGIIDVEGYDRVDSDDE